MRKILGALAASLITSGTFAAGFALYEVDARGTAMAGAVIGKTENASANFFNPANLNSTSGTVVQVGIAAIHPSMDATVDGKHTSKMDSGVFCLPNAFVAQELPAGFTAGLGFFVDNGLGTHYNNNWILASDSVESTLIGYTLTPNLSYKITDDWSVGVGARMVHCTFVQRRIYDLGNHPISGLPLGKTHLKLDTANDVDFGWQLGTQYRITDDLYFGAMYKSRIRLNMEGDSKAHGNGLAGSTVAAAMRDDSIGDHLELPSSVSIGLNWDATEKLHLGAYGTWTEWSTVDQIRFAINGNRQVMDLKWKDTWRTGVGAAYDLTDNFTLMGGYAYDWDPTDPDRENSMLPSGDRNILATGLEYRYDDWTLSIAYSLLLLSSHTQYINSSNPMLGTAERHNFKTSNGVTHILSVSLAYQF